MFWQPEVFAPIFTIAIQKARSSSPTDCFRLPHPGCEAAILRLGQNEHLLLRRAGHAVQARCAGVSIQAGQNYALRYDLPGLEGGLEARLAGVRRFECLYRSSSLSRLLFAAAARGKHLRHVLQALDGHLAGSSHREIALALFGDEKVKASWNDPGRYLFDQTRRLVQRGLHLMRQGYRQFLQ